MANELTVTIRVRGFEDPLTAIISLRGFEDPLTALKQYGILDARREMEVLVAGAPMTLQVTSAPQR